MNTPDLLLDRFLVAKRAKGCTLHTLRWYKMCILPFLTWAEDEQLEYKKPETIEGYITGLRTRKLAPSTISGHYTAIIAWLKWAFKRGYLPTDPTPLLDRPKKFKPLKKRITRIDFIALYNAVPSEKWIDARDRCLLLILYFSGLRLAEVLDLHTTDIDLEEKLISVRHGKGDKPRLVPCHHLLLREIPRYFEMRPPFCGEYLLVASDGHGNARGPLTTGGLRAVLRQRCANAGIKYHNAHAFRHSFAIEFLNNGMEMSAVKDALGHASVKTTENEYAFWLTAGLQREYEDALKRIAIP